MALCSPSELLESGKCFACYSEKQAVLAELSLLCQILHAYNPMAACDPADLLANAKCFMCLSEKQMEAVRIQLLCEILHGGGGGSSCIVCLDGEEEPVEAAPCDCSIAYNQVGRFWFWNTLSSSWMPFIV